MNHVGGGEEGAVGPREDAGALGMAAVAVGIELGPHRRFLELMLEVLGEVLGIPAPEHVGAGEHVAAHPVERAGIVAGLGDLGTPPLIEALGVVGPDGLGLEARVVVRAEAAHLDVAREPPTPFLDHLAHAEEAVVPPPVLHRLQRLLLRLPACPVAAAAPVQGNVPRLALEHEGGSLHDEVDRGDADGKRGQDALDVVEGGDVLGIDGLDAVTAPQARLLGRGPDGDGVEPRAPLHEELTGMRHGLVPQKRLQTLGGHGLLAPGVFLGLLELPLLLGHHLAREGRGNRKGQAHRADRRSDQDTVPAASRTLHDFLHYRLSACLLSGSPGGAGFVEGRPAPASVTERPALMADSRAASEKIPRVIRASEFCARAR